jgi:hypothetical protein
MGTKRWNWRLWVGFAVSGLALFTFLSLFSETRNIFWASLVLFVVAAALLIAGLGRAWRQRDLYRGRIAGPVLASLSLAVFALFGWASYEVFTKTPAARLAPQIGQKAPEFALADSSGATVTLAQVLATPIADASGAKHAPKGVLVVFYRGYW